MHVVVGQHQQGVHAVDHGRQGLDLCAQDVVDLVGQDEALLLGHEAVLGIATVTHHAQGAGLDLHALAAQAHAAERAESAADVVVDRHPVADLDMVDMRADLDHLAAELVPQHGIRFEVVLAFDDLDVRAADADGLDLEQHIIRFLDVGDGFLFEHEVANILENIRLHFFHDYFSFQNLNDLQMEYAHVCMNFKKISR